MSAPACAVFRRRRRTLLEEPSVLGEVEREHEALEEEHVREDEVAGSEAVGGLKGEEERGGWEDEEQLRCCMRGQCL